MKKDKTARQFSVLEFTYLLLGELKKYHLLKFKQSELEKDLYLYSLDPKYSELFLDIDRRARRVSLAEALSHLTICGGVYSIGLDFDTKYINYDLDLDVYSVKDLEKKSLIEELAQDYMMKKQLVAQSPFVRRICKIDPSLQYTVSRGDFLGDILEWNLVTDASHISFEQRDLDYILNPLSFREGEFPHISVLNAKGIDVTLDHYQFALMQGKVNHEIQSALLYTNEEKIEKLQKMVDYASFTKNVQDSSVKFLSLK